MDKKTIFKSIVIPATVTLVAVVLVLLYVFVWRAPSTQDVFNASQSFVVELKSQTDEQTVSYGSAVLIDSNGTLVSNAHMVVYKKSGVYTEFESFAIRFSFETDYHAVSVVKYDIENDIAIFKLEDLSNINIKAPKLADSSKIKSGDTVYAVGNGMNHGVGISQGIVSLPQVNIDYDGKVRSVIQCDLLINEGNSGGALLNSRGMLIGMPSFRIKDNSGNPVYGVAFCIPVNYIIDYLNK